MIKAMIFYTSVVFSTTPGKCPEPKVETKPGLTWKKEDDRIIPVAKKGCVKSFGTKSCLINIKKMGNKRYYAICSS